MVSSAEDSSHGQHASALGKPDLLILDFGADDCLTKPFDAPELLAQLARHAGRVLTHAHLLHAVWGPKAGDQAHYLRVHFTHLRRKLRAAGLPADLIRNEPGIGYRLRLET